MDSHAFFSFTSTSSLLFSFFTAMVLLVSGLFFTFRKKINHQSTKALSLPPQAPGAWPIIGHLHLLNTVEPVHHLFAKMADKYGPIFTVKLGSHLVLVVSDGKIIKECLTTNDKIFASRPKFFAGEVLGYNYAMFGVSPYGAHWQQFRKTAVLQLLSVRRLEMLSYVRESELTASLNDMYRLWSRRSDGSKACLNMKEWFGNLVLNTIIRLICGKRYSPDDVEGAKTFQTLKKIINSLGTYVLSDAIPFLKWLDYGGKVKSMEKSSKDMDHMLQTWLDEHKARRKNSSNGEIRLEEQQDFTDVMINALEDATPQELSNFSKDTVNKATCLALLLAADTTTSTLTWALALLLNHPEELKKLTAEFDEKIGRQRRMIQESDIKNLEYLQAVVKETMRLYPAAPLAFPHQSVEDCTVAGYTIPKGTNLVMNLHKLQRDPKVWSSPNEFKPDRFFTARYKDIDVRGQDFELIPFSSGRRICPGISMGLNMLHLILANLLHSFDLVKPSKDPIKLIDRFGLVGPLDVHFTPRLPHQLYE